ncbi:MAG TPA: hypothetical protein VG711_08765 [Phycisphaerales bacterium]|nr:hypothetical protein [Phycisphaerales bacterium]
MKRPRMFPGIIFALISINFIIVGVTVYFALSDKHFAIDPTSDHAGPAHVTSTDSVHR